MINAQDGFSRINKVLMGGVNNHKETEHHGAMFAQHYNDIEKLKFHRRVIHLMRINTLGVSGKNLVLLHFATDLFSADIGVDVKWLLKNGDSKS